MDLSSVALAFAAQAAAAQADADPTVTAFLGVVLGLAVVIAVVFLGHAYWAAKKTRGDHLTDSNDAVKRLERP